MSDEFLDRFRDKGPEVSAVINDRHARIFIRQNGVKVFLPVRRLGRYDQVCGKGATIKEAAIDAIKKRAREEDV
jgi:hypothetical protein